jgi:hypothetical protein
MNTIQTKREKMNGSANYIYHLTSREKLSVTMTKMPTVEVIRLSDNKTIGTYSWTSDSRDPKQDEIDNIVNEIIREEETRKIWNATKRAT